MPDTLYRVAIHRWPPLFKDILEQWSTANGLVPLAAFALPVVVDQQAMTISGVQVAVKDDSEAEAEFPTGERSLFVKPLLESLPTPLIALAVTTSARPDLVASLELVTF